MHAFYLHGFASSPQSSKATFLAARLKEHGIDLHVPDFNEPDFSTLTITRMVETTVSALDELQDGQAVLIGSSLGAFVAVQAALQRPDRVAALVLLAPALDFRGNRVKDLGDRGLEEWKRTGHLQVFHYGYGRLVPVHYELFADASRYDCLDARLTMPILVFQGRRDTAVDPAAVEAWARPRGNVTLHLLDDDHQLTARLDYIWRTTKGFLGLETTSRSPCNPPGLPPSIPGAGTDR